MPIYKPPITKMTINLSPIYPPTPTPIPPTLQQHEPAHIQQTIQTLDLQPHIEGGYFAETDRHPLRITIPAPNSNDKQAQKETVTRAASSSIQYLLTPKSPLGAFHLNQSRTVHTLHYGRARYVIIHADMVSSEGTAPVETFVVGSDAENGERLSWVVPGGKFKGCFLLPGSEDGLEDGETGLLISEVGLPWR